MQRNKLPSGTKTHVGTDDKNRPTYINDALDELPEEEIKQKDCVTQQHLKNVIRLNVNINSLIKKNTSSITIQNQARLLGSVSKNFVALQKSESKFCFGYLRRDGYFQDADGFRLFDRKFYGAFINLVCGVKYGGDRKLQCVT
ncbi:hypothetical protein TcasGA2_TC003113 [Tribolium castaneum]|uniref:Uncharacterized protein n=1 Tax=Tribolium castaneum TaxID=7070 RepID=D6WFA9_TRICA|nr:hypothetical protein TcasGA2_TC003113 [Tribolium castaneum]